MAMRSDCNALLPTIRVPVLILAGRRDQFVGSDKAMAMAAVMPMAALTVIEHAGHLPMVEQPEDTTAAFRKFLSGVIDADSSSPVEPVAIGA